jgi:hypothetical protein
MDLMVSGSVKLKNSNGLLWSRPAVAYSQDVNRLAPIRSASFHQPSRQARVQHEGAPAHKRDGFEEDNGGPYIRQALELSRLRATFSHTCQRLALIAAAVDWLFVDDPGTCRRTVIDLTCAFDLRDLFRSRHIAGGGEKQSGQSRAWPTDAFEPYDTVVGGFEAKLRVVRKAVQGDPENTNSGFRKSRFLKPSIYIDNIFNFAALPVMTRIELIGLFALVA